MTITTYTDLGLRLQTEVAELKVSLEKEQALTAHHRTVQVELLSKVAELKAEHIAYISRTGARILALHDELGELKAKLAEVSMTTVPNPRVIELYDEDPGDRVCNWGFNTKGTP